MFSFKLVSTDGRARAGEVATPHGVFKTPAFMPVGTSGAIKGLPCHWAEETGAEVVLANTYHLWLKPGAELIRDLGGLHAFTGWPGPMLTDSGGYQAFRLADRVRLDEDGVTFPDPVTGRPRPLDAAGAVRIQQMLGADIIMPLDDCPPHPADHARAQAAVRRTTRWARQGLDAHTRADQALFGIIQGGAWEDLRERSAREITALDRPGYAIGGVSVGEGAELMRRVTGHAAALLPAEKPRYLMGVGTPVDVLDGISMGVDMFDCVLPTRWARHTWALTRSGVLKLKNAAYRADERPLDEECGCVVCGRYPRALFRHLYLAGEMAAPILVSFHNLHFYMALCAGAREAVIEGHFSEYRDGFAARFDARVEEME